MVCIIRKTPLIFLVPILFYSILPQFSFAQTFYAANDTQLQNNNNQSVTQESDIELKDLLTHLHKQYKLRFVYNDQVIKGIKLPIALLDKKPEQVIDALGKALRKSNLQLSRISERQYGITQPDGAVPDPKPEAEVPDQIHVSGIIKDKLGNPLVGVTVKVQGKAQGTITNASGEFALDVAPSDSLIISYIGYQTRILAVRNQTNMQIILKAKEGSLNEVVVVAYGKQKKISVTGALASIQGEELKQSPASNLAVSLAGRLPGLIAIQRSGEPGRKLSELYIRGLGTTNGRNPLILVDGVQRDLTYIDPHEVASVTILKDASATALYGMRGANGVILVTTKRGSEGDQEINLDAQLSAQDFTRTPSVVDAFHYAVLRNLALRNDGLPLQYSAAQIQKYKDGSEPLRYPDNNYRNILMKNFSLQQRYNLNVSGGGKKARYFVNAGYLKQDGQFKVEDSLPYDPSFKLTRYNFRSNIDVDLNSTLHAFMNLAGYLEVQNSPAGVFTTLNPLTVFESSPSLWIMAYLWDIPAVAPGPVVPKGYEHAGEVTTYNNIGWPAFGQINRAGYIRQHNTNVTATYGMEQDLGFITKGLSAKVIMSFDTKATSLVVNDKFFPRYQQVIDPNVQLPNGEDSVYYIHVGAETNTPLAKGNWKFYTTLTNLRGYLNYDRTFSKHHISSLFLAQKQKKVIDAQLPFNHIGLSMRERYSYDNRYFIEFNAGYNGSEQFAKGSRFGFFPAVSAAWVASNESFLRNSPIVSLLKVRGSYGEVGNDQLGGRRFLYLDNVQVANGGYISSLGSGLGGAKHVDINLLSNKQIQWEVAKKLDIGLDMGLFDNALTLNVDVFHQERNNILINRGTVPALIGLPVGVLPPVNQGIVVNHGYELVLKYRKAFNHDFSFMGKINFNYAHNTVKFIDEPKLPEDFAYRYRQTGFPIGQQWGFIVDRYFTSEEDIQKSPVQQIVGHASRPGDFKYKDLSGDGIVDQKDVGPIRHSTIPEYTFGAAFRLTYKNLDASFLFQGVANVNSVQQGRRVFAVNNFVSRHLKSWTESRYKNKEPILYPRLTTQASPNEIHNSFFDVDASYIRLKNFEIGYTLPKRWTSKLGVKQVRIYINGYNVLTWDALPTKDLDPEQEYYTAAGNTYPVTRLFSTGVHFTFR